MSHCDAHPPVKLTIEYIDRLVTKYPEIEKLIWDRFDLIPIK